MAELNPSTVTQHEFKLKNNLTLHPSSYAPDVLQANTPPTNSSQGFEASSTQTGVGVFIPTNRINPNSDSKLEIWLWDGTTWGLWTTIDGKDPNFGNLDSNTINFAWVINGVTYSRMYFNAIHAAGSNFRLLVTGYDSPIAVDGDTSDGVYDAMSGDGVSHLQVKTEQQVKLEDLLITLLLLTQVQQVKVLMNYG